MRESKLDLFSEVICRTMDSLIARVAVPDARPLAAENFAQICRRRPLANPLSGRCVIGELRCTTVRRWSDRTRG